MGFRAPLGILARPRLRYLIAAPWLLAGLGLPVAARGEDPLLKQLFDRQAAAAIQRANSPQPPPAIAAEGAQILVLTDGRVVDGTIQADLHGYRVTTAGANLFFAFDQVKLVARDRSDAYQKMCASDPGKHLERDLRLGRWCLENRLPREAAFHLRKVLEVAPANQEAKSLLIRLEASQTTPGAVVQVGGIAEQASRDAGIVESLARLSPDAVKEFVIGVQPILMARCGRCHSHGAGANTAFHLERVHLAGGGSRTITSRNLETVVHQIDPHFARRSPLLLKAIEPHGGVSRAPLSGGGSDVQKARLLAWLQSVAPELNRLNREDASRRSTDKIAQAGKPEPHRDPQVVPASATAIERPAAVQSPAPTSSAEVFIPPVAQEKPANDLGPLSDPFDPSQFYRRK